MRKKLLPKIALIVLDSARSDMFGCYGNKENLLELIKRLKLNNVVTVHGFLEHPELEKLYNLAHVNMLLSNNNNNTDFEGFGISVLEANLYGVPAIGAKDSGLEDSIRNHYNGVLVNPNNCKEVIDSLKTIFNNYDNYSICSKSYAMDNKWDRKINQYEKYIK